MTIVGTCFEFVFIDTVSANNCPSKSSSVLTTKTAIFHEATNMDKVSSDFVLRIYGIFEGYPPGGTSPKQGIVTEFMRKGSLETLQKRNFPDTPPWALVFRLAFQIALGINSLHSENLLHGDIKPRNILLDNDLNAKVRCHPAKYKGLHET